MPKYIDYTGKKIGRLTFIEDYINPENPKKRFWIGKCDCGNKIKYRGDYIRKLKNNGSTFECNKCKKERRWPDLTNKKFGRLTVIRQVSVPANKKSQKYWLCLCECGVEKVWASQDLNSGIKSCGCYARKIHSKWANTTRYPPAHGAKSKSATRQKRNVYESRNRMTNKCYRKEDPNYHLYGKIGITVCDLWRNGFSDFYQWSLENGHQHGYGIYLKDDAMEFNPQTAYWMDKREYTKKNNSKFITWNNKTQNMSKWAEEFGCPIGSLSRRLKVYPLEKAMTRHIKS